MSSADRMFLESGRVNDHNGSGIHLGLSFPSEKDLDEKLWLDPEHADKDLRYLLKVHQGEMTPALSRIALKAVALPLFIREVYDDTVPAEVQEEVRAVPSRGAQLLDAYMDRVGDEAIDQAMLKQAIDDATVLQLVSRSLRSEATDDIIVLPAGPEEDHADRPTSFTVLRRHKLGRALLFVSSVRSAAHIHTPELNSHRIHIRPNDLLVDNANRYDLAEALIAEQQNAIEPEDFELITAAEAHVHDTINRHFDRIQPHF